MDTATVNFKKNTLQLGYGGKIYDFNIPQSDLEDFWQGFEHNGRECDLNLFIDDKTNLPSLSVYPTKIEFGNVATDILNGNEIPLNTVGKYKGS